MFNFFAKINRVYRSAPIREFSDADKLVIFSDCHRGTGDNADEFAQNHLTYTFALTHYLNEGYTYIELGDGDELWKNTRLEPIITQYFDIFQLLERFHKRGRLILLYGNHDIVKRSVRWRGAHMSLMRDEFCGRKSEIFAGLRVLEGLRLRYRESQREYFLLHGHQADLMCSTFWRLARFLVRHVWRSLELFGLRQPISPAEHRKRKERVELRLLDWSTRTGVPLIAGHTHRPMQGVLSGTQRTNSPSVADLRGRSAAIVSTADNNNNCGCDYDVDYGEYFNSGSCVHPRGITAIELVGGVATLVKWAAEAAEDGTLKLARQIAVAA